MKCKTEVEAYTTVTLRDLVEKDVVDFFSPHVIAGHPGNVLEFVLAFGEHGVTDSSFIAIEKTMRPVMP